MPETAGVLYVVATPIGNLEDLSPRARDVLRRVELIAAEDTRHTAKLLRHFDIRTPMIALHEHNEAARAGALVEQLLAGRSVALVSDAGTPLISDPGFELVRAAHAAGIRVSPVPGPSALIAALSVAGLPTDRFVFEGFLPHRAAARRGRLAALAAEPRTLVFYESVHRLAETLQDMRAAFGPDRRAVVARELTKLHESLHGGTLGELAEWAATDPRAAVGEVVVVVAGAAGAPSELSEQEARRVLQVLLAELPLKQAVRLATRLTGRKRGELYRLALSLGAGKDGGDDPGEDETPGGS